MADPSEKLFGMLLTMSLGVAFVVHAGVAELWIRSTRRSGALRAKLKAEGVKAE
jgi:hypothetical protein